MVAVLDDKDTWYFMNIDGEYMYNISDSVGGKITEVGLYNNDLFPVCSDGKYNYYNIKFKKKLEGYDYAGSFSGGVAAVKKGDKWEVINSKGENITGDKYLDVVLDSRGVCCQKDRIFVKVADYEYIMINSVGERVGKETFENAKLFSNGDYAAIMRNDLWGYVDINGKTYVEPKYENANSYSLGLSAVSENGLWGYIDTKGNVIVKDKDYTVTESGGGNQWFKYTYTVDKTLFANEGEYKLVVSSKDKAENDAFSDVKDATINFVVDRTAPIVTITGMAKNGRYQTESQKVTIVPTDDGGALKSLIVRLVDGNGKVIKEIVNLTGETFEKALEDGAGKIEFILTEGMYQNIQIICNDCAVDEDGNTNTYDETVTNVTVTPNGFMIFWANKPLRWGSIAGVILLSMAIISFVVFKKRKKR